MIGEINRPEKRIMDGRSLHPYWSNYSNMMERCYYPKKDSYRHYGAKGIKVCDEWRDATTGFWRFVKDMGRRPHPTWTIDRIRTDLGYSPKNCRWANPRTQAIRQHGGFTDNTNITKTPSGKYLVKITHHGEILVRKTVPTKKEAIALRDKVIARHHLTYQKVERKRRVENSEKKVK